MSDLAMELLSVTLTRAPLGLKLDAYGFLAAVLDTAEDATRRALRPCDELIGINGTLYDDIPTESTPDAAAALPATLPTSRCLTIERVSRQRHAPQPHPLVAAVALARDDEERIRRRGLEASTNRRREARAAEHKLARL